MIGRPTWNICVWQTPRNLLLLLLGGLLAGLVGCQKEPQYKGRPLSYWKAQLQSKDPRRLQEAIGAVSETGRAGVPALMELLAHPDRKVRKKVLEVLVEMQVGATEEIGEWAEDKPDAQQLLKELCLELQSDGYFIALARAGSNTIPIFAELLANDDRRICWSAAMALEEMQPTEAAIPLLKQALKHPHREVRERAAESLRACIQFE